MLTRQAQDDDVPAIVALHQRWDTHWFGAPEHDEAEVRESFDRAPPERTRLLLDDGKLVAAAWWWAAADTAGLVVDPDLDPVPAYDDLVPWLAAGGARSIDALAHDVALLDALARHGWEHSVSQYELIRAVDGWVLDAPAWPAGVHVTDVRSEDAAAVHQLVYERAHWASVPGHGNRDLEQWQALFLGPDVDPAQQVLAWRGDELVGAALGKTFSDGAGWVAQLAVAGPEQGRGLGRALLLEAFGRRGAAGATSLGLGVSAANPDALRLYLSVGLEVDREWRTHSPTPDPREGRPSPVGERETLLEYLRHYRLTFELKCAGLDAEQLARRSVPPSTLSLLGLVRHLAKVEHSWFRRVMGHRLDLPRLYWAEGDRDLDFDGALGDPAVVADAWESWRREVAHAEAFVAGAETLDLEGAHDDGPIALREVLVHLIEEYARHCGHADLLRECLDGRTGQ